MPGIREKGERPIRQLSLVHEGDFGFKASLVVNVGSQYSGQLGNLYYHDSDGKMVFINAGKIHPDGNVSLEFSHASDYVIVMSDKEMSQSDVPAEISPTQKKEQVVSPKKSAKTGDETNIVYWMVLGMIALGVYGVLVLHPGRNYSFVLTDTDVSHIEQNYNCCPDSFLEYYWIQPGQFYPCI